MPDPSAAVCLGHPDPRHPGSSAGQPMTGPDERHSGASHTDYNQLCIVSFYFLHLIESPNSKITGQQRGGGEAEIATEYRVTEESSTKKKFPLKYCSGASAAVQPTAALRVVFGTSLRRSDFRPSLDKESEEETAQPAGEFEVQVGRVPFSPFLYGKKKQLLGNHETDNMNQIYGFEGEVKAKYTAQMYELFSEVFEWLPLAQCINGKVLIMHGGLFSEDGVTLDDIRKIERSRQPPDSGPMCDLLWSDPQPQNGRSVSKRGVSCQFGPDVTKAFLEENKLDYIIRSHEVKAEGYEVAHGGRCVTVFSAPNYCDQMGNKAAYIHLRGSDLRPQFHQFTAVPHPDVKPMAYASTLLQLGIM
ncbi:unnamed protein product [Rangifer tarandus platyrhynchus]|uniref:Serine/threonine specific protein phosphatases domain-containing protein n=2 Tax=Rangifer tarandus platyrhynchus TaxID=3082113 RepID=A0ABN8YRV3_RANTA|nr:unnamed protein product [Rangifer tarandus platyrhynchus]